VETVFLMASESNQFIASRFVKEIARLGGDITHFVSPRVAERVKAQFVHSEKGIDSDNDPTRPTLPVPDVKQPL
jgi:pantetheine-phosphate adenylyltransferase